MADITTTFLNEQRLKELTPVAENVDPKILSPAIIRVHDMYILPLLGTAMYNDMKTQVEADETLAGYTAYKTLIQSYLQITIAYYTLYEVIPEIWMRIRNVSVTQKSSGGSTPVQASDMDKMRDQYRNIAEYYAQRTIDYVRAQASSGSFALYLSPGTTFDTVFPKTSMYQTGIYIGDAAPQVTRDEFYELWEKFF